MRCERSTRACDLIARARQHRERGEWAEARGDLAEALSIAKRAKDAYAEGRALTTLGLLESLEGKLVAARVCFEAARARFARAGDKRWEGLSIGNLGSLHQRAGRLEEARACYERTLAVVRAAGDETSEAVCLSNLGLLAQEMGRLEEAQACCEKALRLHEAGGRADHVASELVYLAGIELERGAIAHAERTALHAIAMLAKTGARPFEALARGMLGAMRASRGLVDEGRALLDGATADLEAMRARPLLEAVRVHAGHVDLARDDVGEAERRVREGAAAAHLTDEIRVALRVLERAIRAHGAGSDEGALVVGSDARWFRPPHRPRVDLGRRHRLRSVLGVLVRARAEAPGRAMATDAIFRAAWPGESAVRRSGANRVYVALATLREMGLRGILRSADDGYALDQHVPLVRAADV